jgi:hypothetical protein
VINKTINKTINIYRLWILWILFTIISISLDQTVDWTGDFLDRIGLKGRHSTNGSTRGFCQVMFPILLILSPHCWWLDTRVSLAKFRLLPAETPVSLVKLPFLAGSTSIIVG